MDGFCMYGLREARKIIRHARKLVARDNGDYARGYRAALKLVDQTISLHIHDIRERNIKTRQTSA
jgi:hypothetical protein